MWDSLTGIIIVKEPAMVLLQAQPFTYQLSITMQSFSQLAEIGQSEQLFLHVWMREDGWQAYGFKHQEERNTFRELLKINGIGPRSAQLILSSLTVRELQACIQQQDVTGLVKLPGIGRKTAERLLLEFKDRQLIVLKEENIQDSTMTQQAYLALIQLGFSKQEAKSRLDAIRHLSLADDAASWIQAALQVR